MMPAHMVGRSIVMSASLVDGIGGTRHRSAVEACNALANVALYVGRLVADIRSLRHQLQHVVDARTEDDPGLASYFCGDPAREQCDQTRRPHSQGEALEPARVIEFVAQAKYQPE